MTITGAEIQSETCVDKDAVMAQTPQPFLEGDGLKNFATAVAMKIRAVDLGQEAFANDPETKHLAWIVCQGYRMGTEIAGVQNG